MSYFSRKTETCICIMCSLESKLWIKWSLCSVFLSQYPVGLEELTTQYTFLRLNNKTSKEFLHHKLQLLLFCFWGKHKFLKSLRTFLSLFRN